MPVDLLCTGSQISVLVPVKKMKFITESRPTERRWYNWRGFLLIITICTVSYYTWNKICQVLFHQKSQEWWHISALWNKSTDGRLYSALLKSKFYKDLLYSVYEDFFGCLSFFFNLILYIGAIIDTNVYIFLITCLIMAAITYVIFYTYQHKDQQDREKKETKTKKNAKGQSSKDKCTTSQELAVLRRRKMYRRWAQGLLFFAFLISIPWEFVRLYQSMVAEKVSQMKAGIPPDCVPEEMSFYHRVRSFIRMQVSWSDDPCLVYHKALLVDPMWQVNPLMVITSAFSQCIIYPIEILFGGLGRSFRLFFSEIPAQWQPFMLIVIVIFMALGLVMMFGYRIHLPFLLKLEPKSPRYVRMSSRSHPSKTDLNESDYSVMSTQDIADQSSLETQFTLDSQ